MAAHSNKGLWVLAGLAGAWWLWGQSSAAGGNDTMPVNEGTGSDGTTDLFAGFDPAAAGGGVAPAASAATDNSGTETPIAPAPATAAPDNTNAPGAGHDPVTGTYVDSHTPAPIVIVTAPAAPIVSEPVYRPSPYVPATPAPVVVQPLAASTTPFPIPAGYSPQGPIASQNVQVPVTSLTSDFPTPVMPTSGGGQGVRTKLSPGGFSAQ
jgi:hypothetical protein